MVVLVVSSSSSSTTTAGGTTGTAGMVLTGTYDITIW